MCPVEASGPIVRRLGDQVPRIAASAWVAPGAVVVGEGGDGDGGQAWARRSSGFALFDKMWLIPIFRVSESERAGDWSRGVPTRLATESDSPSASARGSKSPTWYSQHLNEHASDDD